MLLGWAVKLRGQVGRADEGRAGWRFLRTNNLLILVSATSGVGGRRFRGSREHLLPTQPHSRWTRHWFAPSSPATPRPPSLTEGAGVLGRGSLLPSREGGRWRGWAPRQLGSHDRTLGVQPSAEGPQPGGAPSPERRDWQPAAPMRAERRAGAEPGLRAGGGWLRSRHPRVHLVTASSLPSHARADLAAPSLGATTSGQGRGATERASRWERNLGGESLFWDVRKQNPVWNYRHSHYNPAPTPNWLFKGTAIPYFKSRTQNCSVGPHLFGDKMTYMNWNIHDPAPLMNCMNDIYELKQQNPSPGVRLGVMRWSWPLVQQAVRGPGARPSSPCSRRQGEVVRPLCTAGQKSTAPSPTHALYLIFFQEYVEATYKWPICSFSIFRRLL